MAHVMAHGSFLYMRWQVFFHHAILPISRESLDLLGALGGAFQKDSSRITLQTERSSAAGRSSARPEQRARARLGATVGRAVRVSTHR